MGTAGEGGLLYWGAVTRHRCGALHPEWVQRERGVCYTGGRSHVTGVGLYTLSGYSGRGGFVILGGGHTSQVWGSTP